MRNYLTEFIGTFFLVLTVGFCVTSNAPLGALAIGSSLMIMVYMGGHISGGHYNGAVSLAVFLRGKIDARTFVGYLISQILGAIAAALIVYLVTSKTYPLAPGPGVSPTAALIVETLYTFALASSSSTSRPRRIPRATRTTVWRSASRLSSPRSVVDRSRAAPSTRTSAQARSWSMRSSREARSPMSGSISSARSWAVHWRHGSIGCRTRHRRRAPDVTRCVQRAPHAALVLCVRARA